MLGKPKGGHSLVTEGGFEVSETEATKYCKTCKENTPHTCSGTGRKGWCEICGTTFDNTKPEKLDLMEAVRDNYKKGRR